MEGIRSLESDGWKECILIGIQSFQKSKCLIVNLDIPYLTNVTHHLISHMSNVMDNENTFYNPRFSYKCINMVHCYV